MKKVISLGLCSASVLCSMSAFAQSSVTLYGILDVGLNYQNNSQTGRSGGALVGHSQYSMQDGSYGQNGSRWGLLGSEDLGGGLSALFRLESGFSLPTGALGQGGAGVGRQSYVGLSSTTYGTVTFGRQYDLVANYIGPLSSASQWAGYLSAHAGDIDNVLNTRRINNAIKYQSQKWNGFSFGGMYSFGGIPGSVGRNQVWSAGLGYSIGQMTLGAAYLNARNPNQSFYGTNPNAGNPTVNNIGSIGGATSPQSNPIYAGYASASTLQIAAAGASYQLGAFTLDAVYSNVQFRGLGSTGVSGPNPFGYHGTATFNNAEAGVKWQISPTLVSGLEYVYTHNSGSDGQPGATYHQGSVGLDYFLSKRTDVYTFLVYQHASGTDSFNQPAVASLALVSPSSNNHQLGVRVGLRHRF